jgi:hypothetical protein
VNLSQLRDRVRSLTSILATSVLSDAELDAFINEAHTSFCLTADWPFLLHTVTVDVAKGASSVTLTLPSGRTAQRVVDVYATDQPGGKPWQVFERAQPTIGESWDGRVREYDWAPTPRTVSLYPSADRATTLRVRVVLDPSTLTASTDQPLVPAAFRHGIAYLAASAVLEREADRTGRAQTYGSKATEVVSDMRRLLLASGRPTFTLGGRVSQRRGARRQVW